ncbi:hypothetical protein Dthio_PD3622 [Desulfonatronospira thiodismutans ASO3-1]|uniref:Uncharacterized protein n=1 Tax=Desulfonatronospira thiodismutans ASO3-1 TaxID=555779 RepID=D6SJW3_9BACT|nr:hypothetical protein [Desulfonatronospira thiodismutans]EFI36166.1 hypothetical protein Dthio_PD3622 [Desulfonatronospira thiodismutans ASO3-1]
MPGFISKYNAYNKLLMDIMKSELPLETKREITHAMSQENILDGTAKGKELFKQARKANKQRR